MRHTRTLLLGSPALAALALAPVAWATVTGSLLPASDGTYKTWTTSAGTIHYTLVDETTCNGLTDYNKTSTVGNRDSYGVNLAAVPNGATITQISITPCASRNAGGTGSSTMNLFYRYNGLNSADSGAYALSGTTPTNLAATNFSGLSITKTAASTLQIGAVYSAGTLGARLSRLATVITYTPLSAPTGLVATESGTTSAILTWTDASTNELGFKIERSTNSALGPWVQVGTGSLNATSFVNTGLTPNQTYYYRLKSYNAGGTSSPSNSDYAITYSTVPNAPTALTATASGSTAIKLTWTDASTNEDGFKIERATGALVFSEIATKPLNVLPYPLTYTDTALASGTYYYRVRAHNVIGNSSYSGTSTGVTLP